LGQFYPGTTSKFKNMLMLYWR